MLLVSMLMLFQLVALLHSLHLPMLATVRHNLVRADKRQPRPSLPAKTAGPQPAVFILTTVGLGMTDGQG